jgi:hypothetical protein
MNQDDEERALVPGPGPEVVVHDAVADDNENNNNAQQQQQQQQQRPMLQIQDEAEWFRQYGLCGEPHYGWESYNNRQEAKQRIQVEQSYQQQVHEQAFEDSKLQQISSEQQRQKQLHQWEKESITLYISSSDSGDATTPTATATIECRLRELASQSDTVFTMAVSRHHYANDNDTTLRPPTLSLSLTEFSPQAVHALLELISKLCSSLEDSTTAKKVSALIESTIPADAIIDCCRLAHYLQCTDLLDSIVAILVHSVDSANCMSICQLADQLQLPSLCEASLSHMMKSLGSLEDHEVWGDLTSELQERILTIKSVLQSSNRRQLFFGSFTEYIAMFAEQVDYYRERLEEAQVQQERQQHKHHRHSPSRGWEYAQSKIELQSQRVHVLKMVLAEQKKLFGNSR